MSKKVQIVAFDNPYPPDYGGAIDVFYKIESLYNLGFEIDLHYFSYGSREPLGLLDTYCENIYSYTRPKNIKHFFSKIPFIVITRSDKVLLKRLSKADAPIIFEGLHTCFFLDHTALKNHKKIVRTHNIEHDYYWGLKEASSHFAKKIFYKKEAQKLEAFESVLKQAQHIAAITESDALYFDKYAKTTCIPAFHKSFGGDAQMENYILFHGNLSVEENIEAAVYLLTYVFSKIDFPVKIAGKNPHPAITQLAKKLPHVKVIANPNDIKMDALLVEAKCHAFFTSQNTGVKLKLIHAILSQGHIVMNNDMLFDEKFKAELNVVDSPEEYIQKITDCMNAEEVLPRPALKKIFDNNENAIALERLLLA